MEVGLSWVIIVIPIYKEFPDIFEDVSLRQVFNVLGKYPVCFVAPDSLRLDAYGNYGKTYMVERFADEFFAGLEGYTRLLMSQEFYGRFLNYKYMLLYQTDAFVFSDKLEYFCRLGYDYIGAPIKEFGWNRFHVGNGGLSLRKILSIYILLEQKERIISGFSQKEKDILLHAEDYFFGYCGWDKKINFVVPSVWTAAEFSVERDVGHGFRNIPQRGLPFGCHHWNIMNYKIWRPFIEKYGFLLPSEIDWDWDTLETDREKRLESFLYYVIRHEKCRELLVDTGLSKQQPYSIWGAGCDGRKCLLLLKKIPVPVRCIYDKAAEHIGSLEGIDVRVPKEGDLIKRESKMIIATGKYQDEISKYLGSIGLVKDDDFLFFSSISEKLKRKLEKIYPRIQGITEKFTGLYKQEK